jgi:hypothetical protein
MANDPISAALADAKGAIAKANTKFPSAMAPRTPAPKPAAPAAAPKASMSTGEPEKGIKGELADKASNVDSYVKALPKMHKGGPVMTDGAYQLKAGEHVLTAPEAVKAKKHALMASGIKSLAQAGPSKKGNDNDKSNGKQWQGKIAPPKVDSRI